jgi:hypothetical protein
LDQPWSTEMLNGSDQLKALAFLPDGKLVTAGVMGSNPDAQVIIWNHASPGTISVSPASFNFRVIRNATVSPAISVVVQNSTTTGTDSMAWTASSGMAWLSLSKTSGSLTPGSRDSFSAVVDHQSLSPGDHSAAIMVTGANSANGTVTVYVTGTVLPEMAVNNLKIANNKMDMSDPNRVIYFMIKDGPGKAVKVNIYDSAGAWIGYRPGTTDSAGVAEISFHNQTGELSNGRLLGPGVYWATIDGSSAKKQPFMITLGNR